jgi:methylenetetrahydrofolate reductase (NADPH)
LRIGEAYEGERPVFSFEFFPPETDAGAENLMRSAVDLKAAVQPDYISVTYGAGGTTRDRSFEVVTKIHKDLGIRTMAHQTCVAATRDHIASNVERLWNSGIMNILALRGDPPEDEETFTPPENGYSHASDLIEWIRENTEMEVGAACYPEKHPESLDAEDDLNWTAHKVEVGASFLITQLFFDNTRYFDFVERARENGIKAPIVPGIMPITNVNQIERFTKMCGASIPEDLRERLHAVADDPAVVMATGIEHAITQCRELLERGAPGLHFYTLNKSHATRSILAAVR